MNKLKSISEVSIYSIAFYCVLVFLKRILWCVILHIMLLDTLLVMHTRYGLIVAWQIKLNSCDRGLGWLTELLSLTQYIILQRTSDNTFPLLPPFSIFFLVGWGLLMGALWFEPCNIWVLRVIDNERMLLFHTRYVTGNNIFSKSPYLLCRVKL